MNNFEVALYQSFITRSLCGINNINTYSNIYSIRFNLEYVLDRKTNLQFPTYK